MIPLDTSAVYLAIGFAGLGLHKWREGSRARAASARKHVLSIFARLVRPRPPAREPDRLWALVIGAGGLTYRRTIEAASRREAEDKARMIARDVSLMLDDEPTVWTLREIESGEARR